MAGELIIVGGILMFAFAILVLTKPNIAIPGTVLGTPAAYVAYVDGIWVLVQTIAITAGILIAIYLLGTYFEMKEQKKSSAK